MRGDLLKPHDEHRAAGTGERKVERVCLAIIQRDGTQIEADALLSHLNEAGLSKYDMPEFFIRMEAFPLTASGKILKRELVEWTKAGKIAPTPVRWVAKS